MTQLGMPILPPPSTASRPAGGTSCTTAIAMHALPTVTLHPSPQKCTAVKPLP